MRKGKMVAQGSHSSIAFLLNKRNLALSKDEQEWVSSGQTKICLQIDSEVKLLELFANAKKANLTAYLIQDTGKTEFDGVPTYTCLAIGPNKAEEIDKLTGNLKLL
jgi:PTH2 family peptidyl-tRNA hydrolase